MACSSSSNELETEYIPELPTYFAELPVYDDNPLSKEKVELGRKLFFDPILSDDKNLSCASCHIPTLAFSDGQKISIGDDGRKGVRNAPSLTNTIFNKFYFWEGGVSRLEQQVLGPLQDSNEMHLPVKKAIKRLNNDKVYKRLFSRAFNDTATTAHLTRAFAAFQSTILSYSSPYDQYLQGDSSALSSSAKKGMKLFFSRKTNCSSCHSGFNFTNDSFANNGMFKTYQDAGRWRITTDSNDFALFKIPTLRNVEITAPYMHNGEIQKLDTVIERYSKGGSGFKNKDKRIKALDLSKEEKRDLANFLKSLTDSSFINKDWQNEVL
mgnify:CR=1 FL=1